MVWLDNAYYEGGNVWIRVNGKISTYFKTHKGLRQGDFLSAMLFDLAIDALVCCHEESQN